MKTSFSINTLFAEQAAAYPNAPALLAVDRAPLSYAGLHDHLCQTVATLHTLGIGRNDRVAIVLPNGPAMAMAFLAVATGATAAPLNPAYRAQEFDFYLQDLDAKAVIVATGFDSPVRAVAAARTIPLIALTPDATTAGLFTVAGQKAEPPASTGFAEADDVALILHTSGTTARPKMVPLTQRNLLCSAHNIGTTLQLTPQDRCLNVMPLFHIHGLMAALLASLAAGGSVVCTPGFDAARFFAWLRDHRPSWYTAVPTMHQAILGRATIDPESSQAVHLRFVRSSSSSLPPTVMTALENHFSAPVIEAYGMTEAAHQMTSNPLPPAVRKPGSVGMAAGPEVAIMAAEQDIFLNVGDMGEVVIRGENVTAGYLNHSQANAKSFVDDWFRTGDQGYLDAEGYLYLTGRLKEIINRGGEKIAPREVDEALLAHPAVAQAVTFALPHVQLGETVAAAVVTRQGSAVTVAALRDFVAARLAYFKVPSQIFLLDTIPPGPTGKLQRIGFAERMGISPPPPTIACEPYVAPRTPLEETLVGFWREVLHVEEIGIHANFLALGGDSLAATRLATRILEHFQLELPLHVLLDAPTIADQAPAILQFILEQQTSAQAAALIAEVKQAQIEVSAPMPSKDGPGHWSKVAQAYHQTQSPLHPCAEDIAVMERFVAQGTACSGAPGLSAKQKALLLGVTPAIATMAWPQGTSLLAIDSSEGMLHAVWPGDRPGVRQAEVGDWLALPVADATQSIVIGDGSLNCLEFPTGCQQLVNSVARVLQAGGIFVLRLYTQPPNKPSPPQLFEELTAGCFHTFDGFKFLLNIALTDENFNVAVQSVWQHWTQAQVDKAALCRRTGWSSAGFSTIAYYQNSPARYSFPTLAAVEPILRTRFDWIDMAIPSYPLGECCPILLLRKRS